jgi:Cell division protein
VNFSSFKYLVKQGWHNMRMNRLMSVASVGVLTACLIITGIAGLLSVNVNSFVKRLNDQNVIIIYLYDDISPQQMESLVTTFTEENNITGYTYVTKEQALAEMISRMDEYEALFEGYSGDKNMLPASYRISLTDLIYHDEIVSYYTGLPGVEKVSSSINVVNALLLLKNIVNVVGWGLVAALGLVSVVVISNTIRLTVFARRKEINIMKFVGATNAFIRLPFLVEGVTVGFCAAMLAFCAVFGAYYGVLAYSASNGTWISNMFFDFIPYQKVWYWLLGIFCTSGIFVGGIGSITSMQKHLKV